MHGAAADSGAPPPDEAGANIALYERQMEQIERHFSERGHKLAQGYLDDLAELKARFQEAGDLEGWELVDTEIKRFVESFDLQARVPPSPLAALNELRNTHKKYFLRMELDRAGAVIDACRYQRQQFEALKRRLTQEGLIDEAKSARGFIETIESRSKDAEFGKAVLESELRQLETPELPSQTEGAPELDLGQMERLRAIYESEGSKIDSEYLADVASWGNSYVAALDRLEAVMKSKGDLEGLESVISERDRFLLEDHPLGDLPSDWPAALRDVHGQFQRLRTGYPRARDQKLLRLLGLYLKYLDDLKQAYVREGKIEEARAVRLEIERREGARAEMR
jgi:hypothetical protein